MHKIITLLITLAFLILNVFAEEFQYILHDNCIDKLFLTAEKSLNTEDIEVLRIPQGIILRFEIKNPLTEYENLSSETLKKIAKIEYILSKIKNLVIIEVHTGDFSSRNSKNPKNWEISTVIANKIEDKFFKSGEGLDRNRILSVGYGEFLPPKNTPYNGGKYINRVDIIILCNISGE